jgi:hypothetical protein
MPVGKRDIIGTLRNVRTKVHHHSIIFNYKTCNKSTMVQQSKLRGSGCEPWLSFDSSK